MHNIVIYSINERVIFYRVKQPKYVLAIIKYIIIDDEDGKQT